VTLDCATGRVSKPQESICYLPLSFFKTVRGRKPGFCWNGSERRLATITGVSGEAYSLNLTITLLIISQQLIDPAKHETLIETVECLAVCVVVLTIPFMSSCTIAMTTLSQRWWKPVSPRGCIRHWTPSVFTSLKMLSRSQWPQPLMSRFIFPDKQAGSLAGCPSLFCRLCHPAYAGHQFLFFTFSSVCISVMMFLCWYVFLRWEHFCVAEMLADVLKSEIQLLTCSHDFFLANGFGKYQIPKTCIGMIYWSVISIENIYCRLLHELTLRFIVIAPLQKSSCW